MSGNIERSLWQSIAAETPEPVSALRGIERLWESLVAPDRQRFLAEEEPLRMLVRLLAASPGLVPFLVRHPDWVVHLFLDRGIQQPYRPEHERTRFLTVCRSAGDAGSLARSIARFRNAELVRLYAQEILGLRSPPSVWRDWTAVVGCCIQGAIDGCGGDLPGNGEGVGLAVIGMGKMAGHELNFASDIDLLFVYRSHEANPEKIHTLAAQWATRTVRVLEMVTDEGPAFRVDLGLRPGGKDGALVQTLEGAEIYYQTQAVTWERLALIRARPVAGDPELGSAFVDLVQPFIFRKYLDYGSLEEIRALKQRIQSETRWKRTPTIDVKMGRGGIRELEFFVQTLQLIFGGKRPSLRSPETLETLEALRGEGLIEPGEADELRDAYLFLRLVEHKVQMVYHRQTHRLPADEAELRRIAGLMGYVDPASFRSDLQGYMERTHLHFARLLEAPRTTTTTQSDDSRGEEILAHLDDEETALAVLEGKGFQRPRTVFNSLHRMLADTFPAFRSPRAGRILPSLLPGILDHALDTPVPDQTLFRLERFFEAVGPRGGYYALLEENPETLRYLVAMVGQSALLARLLESHLEAIDALIGDHQPQRSKEEILQEVGALLQTMSDPEERLGRLRAMRAQELLRIGAADLWGMLDPLAVGAQLTVVAEVFLAMTLQEVLQAYGFASAEAVPFCVLGLGSFGGRELSYRSDLDMVFLFENRGRLGTLSVERLTRLGQRLISWMTMPMAEGAGWPVDLRLRPSGNRGPLMVSLESLGSYHQKQAHMWERQTLLKARHCAGNAATGARAAEVIDGILQKTPCPEPKAFHTMRMRMERERGKADPDEVHLKVGRGGMSDIEFVVQYYQLRGWTGDRRIQTTETARALQTLTSAGWLTEEESAVLGKAHRLFKGVENRLALVLDHKGTDRPCRWEQIEALSRAGEPSWIQADFGPREKLADLLQDVMGRVREIYLRHLGQ
jgi:glutamate-ammonia-ligase adenylyltransferase